MKFFNELVSNAKGEIYIIAEACDNHMGSYDIAIGLVDAAVYSGANAVKFQHHLANEEMLEDTPMSDNFDEPLFDFLNRNSLTLDEHKKLSKYCNEKNITYLCTPFSYKAASEIKDLVPFFKIGSGEFQDRWFIDQLMKLNKPILFSSGMCEWDELVSNIEYISSNKSDFSVLNCLSEYPPKYEDMNLKVIDKLKNHFPNLIIGHSDHSPDIYTSIVAASFGAQIIEKHLTLSNFVPGPDQSVSINPKQFKNLVNVLRYIRSTLGDKKIVNKREIDIRDWAYRSIISKKNLNIGDSISEECIVTKRPGTGIQSKYYKDIIGKKLRKNIKANNIIYWDDLVD